jgi:non-homologous end joining protein Ku
MAPRANWKGYLRLSLVSCPIALYPASSLSEKVSFNRINRKTGYWRRYLAGDCASEWATRARRSLKFCEIQLNSVAVTSADSDKAA